MYYNESTHFYLNYTFMMTQKCRLSPIKSFFFINLSAIIFSKEQKMLFIITLWHFISACSGKIVVFFTIHSNQSPIAAQCWRGRGSIQKKLNKKIFSYTPSNILKMTIWILKSFDGMILRVYGKRETQCLVHL